jgi:hypothetical protein
MVGKLVAHSLVVLLRRNIFVDQTANSSLLLDRDPVECFQDIWAIVRAENLLLVSSPLGLINAINPIFNLHDHTSIFLDYSRLAGVVEEALSFFQSLRAWFC